MNSGKFTIFLFLLRQLKLLRNFLFGCVLDVFISFFVRAIEKTEEFCIRIKSGFFLFRQLRVARLSVFGCVLVFFSHFCSIRDLTIKYVFVFFFSFFHSDN